MATLAAHASEFEVHSASSGRQAMEYLARQPADILITALDMPEMDGFELTAFALAQRPDASVVVIGDHRSGRVSQIMQPAEAFYHLRRPVTPTQLLQLLRSLRPGGATGHLHGLSLAALLQMLGVEGKTCGVAVRGDQTGGRIEFESGEIVHAECGLHRGREAVFEMLDWQAPDLRIEAAAESGLSTMRAGVSQILIEAAWHWDEQTRAGQRRGPEAGDSGEWSPEPHSTKPPST